MIAADARCTPPTRRRVDVDKGFNTEQRHDSTIHPNNKITVNKDHANRSDCRFMGSTVPPERKARAIFSKKVRSLLFKDFNSRVTFIFRVLHLSLPTLNQEIIESNARDDFKLPVGAATRTSLLLCLDVGSVVVVVVSHKNTSNVGVLITPFNDVESLLDLIGRSSVEK
jgi:hypothetical protein